MAGGAENVEALLAAQQGFPSGRIRVATSVDSSRFVALALLYAGFANSDPVKQLMRGMGTPIAGQIESTAVLSSTGGTDALPIISVAGIAANLAGIKIGVFVELSAGDRALDRRARGALVGEEVAAGERVLARLHVHVDAAGGEERDGRQQRAQGTCPRENPGFRRSWNPTLAHPARKDGAPGFS